MEEYPAEAAAEDRLSSFACARVRFTATAATPLRLPHYKGSTFHGGLGHALKQISAPLHQYLCQPQAKGDAPKPYVIVPPLETRTDYAPGETLQFELILIGAAIQHLPIFFAAFDLLGATLGIGKPPGNYRIDKVEHLDATGQAHTCYQHGVWRQTQPAVTGREIAQARTARHGDRLTLKFQTRLRLKENEHLVRQPPSFNTLLERLLGRLHTLGALYHNSDLLPRDKRNALLDTAATIQTTHTDMAWDDWSRYSGRQKEWMKFGGLLGTITYQGDLEPFMPYLALGEWVHVGGKTSFGLGRYEIISTGE